MSQDISHDGIVTSIDGRTVTVSILQASACGACQMASRCKASEVKEKTVTAETSPGSFSVGQKVRVTVSNTVARRALLISFALPLLLMMGVLAGVLAAGHSETTAGLAALAVLAPYYLVLWLLREKVGRSVSFSIEPVLYHA